MALMSPILGTGETSASDVGEASDGLRRDLRVNRNPPPSLRKQVA